MTDWTPETDMNIAHKERISLEFGLGVAYNPRAMFEGATGAPRMNPLALGDLTAGDTLSCGAQTEITLASGTGETALEFSCMQGGSVRVKGQYSSGSNAVDVTWSVSRVRAGVSTLIATYTDANTGYRNFPDADVSIQYGDLIRVNVSAVDTLGGVNSGYVRNVSIYTDGTQPIWTTSNFGYIYV